MGDRVALWSQQNSTEDGKSAATWSAAEMQHANQGEKAPRGVCIDLGLAFEALLQNPRPFVVNAPPGHIDRLDLRRRQRLDRVEIAFTDLPVILDHLPERAERQVE